MYILASARDGVSYTREKYFSLAPPDALHFLPTANVSLNSIPELLTRRARARARVFCAIPRAHPICNFVDPRKRGVIRGLRLAKLARRGPRVRRLGAIIGLIESILPRDDPWKRFQLSDERRAGWISRSPVLKIEDIFGRLERTVMWPCGTRSNTMFAGDAHLYSGLAFTARQ